MLTYNEYTKIASYIIYKNCDKSFYKKLTDDQNLGDAVTVLMKADKDFNGFGTIEGYRKQLLKWWIYKQIKSIKKQSVNKQYIADMSNEPVYHHNFESVLVKDLLSTLDTEEQFLIKERFYNNCTLDEIGKKMNITREYVRQKINKILLKLRKSNVF